MSFPVPAQLFLYFGLLAACALLGLGLMVRAWQRPRQRQRGWRVLAGGLAALALWGMAFPPRHHLPATPAQAILLTPGYSADTLSRLLRQLGQGTPVWTIDSISGPALARPLPSLLALTEQQPPLQRLHVLGDGLPAADLPLLAGLARQTHGSAARPGLQTAYWPRQLALGQTLLVEGSVTAFSSDAAASPAASSVWVVLRAASGRRDSARLPGSGGSFRLRFSPKVAGLAVYELLLRRPGQPTQAEPLPVEIITPPLPAVLLLAAVPSFEFRFLHEYLGEAHYPVALRTGVSRGLVQTGFLNQPSLPLQALTPALLAHYDVVVADAASLAAASAPEARALQNALSAGRMGLVMLAEAQPLPRAAPGRAAFALRARPTPAAMQSLRWPSAPGPAKAALPGQLLPSAQLRPLVYGPAGLLAAARCRVGLGLAVVSVVPETFQWRLAGQSAVYASFWNQLLGAAVPPAPMASQWRPGSRWPRPHQPCWLHLAGAAPSGAVTVAALAGGPHVRLALRQDPRLPERSTAQFWPPAAGWYRLAGPGPAVASFYVYPPTAWAGPEQLARRTAARRWAAVTSGAGRLALGAASFHEPGAAKAPLGPTQPWPTGWFFALFLLAAGYLWLEEKL